MALLGPDGEPVKNGTKEVFEAVLPPKVNVELKEASAEYDKAQADAATAGLQLASLVRISDKAIERLEEANRELERVKNRAAKSSGVKESQIRGFNTERGVALYVKE